MKKILAIITLASLAFSSTAQAALSYSSSQQKYDYRSIEWLPQEALNYYEYLDQDLKNQYKSQSIRERYYKEAQQLAHSDKKKEFVISKEDRAMIEKDILAIQWDIAQTLESALDQVSKSLTSDNIKQTGKYSFNVSSPYGVLDIKFNPLSSYISRAKWDLSFDTTIKSELKIPNKSINDMASSLELTGSPLVNDGLTQINVFAELSMMIKGDNIYVTLKNFDLTSSDPRIKSLMQYVTPYIGTTYHTDGGKQAMRAAQEVDTQSIIKDLRLILDGLKTKPYLVPYRKIDANTFALRGNASEWKSLRKKMVNRDLRELVPGANFHDYNNLVYTKWAILIKPPKGSKLQWSLGLSLDSDQHAAFKGTLTQNTKRSNKKSYENSFQIEISHKIFSLDAKSDEVDAQIKSDYKTINGSIVMYDTYQSPRIINQTITIKGNAALTNGMSHLDLTIANQENIRGSLRYDMALKNEKNQVNTTITFDIPAAVFAQYAEYMSEYTHASLPKDIHFESVSEWIEEVTTMILEKPKSYVELN